MKILRIKKTVFFDVFTGIGWKNHTRITYKEGKVNFISGVKLPKIKFVEIAKTLGIVK